MIATQVGTAPLAHFDLPLMVCSSTQFLTTISSVIGTAGLVFYTFPYLGILFVPMINLYYLAALYYRRSSVEMKRLDSLLRSYLYASYSGGFFSVSLACIPPPLTRARRNPDRPQHRARLPLAIPVHHQVGREPRSGEQGVLHDDRHPTMARCPPRHSREHTHPRHWSLRGWVQEHGQPLEDWCGLVLYDGS